MATEFSLQHSQEQTIHPYTMKFNEQTAASGFEGLPTFRDLTPSPSSACAGGLVAHPDDGDGVLETSENLRILARLFVQENFIEFCRRKSFKTYDSSAY